MIVHCWRCGMWYEDVYRWTDCPHAPFPANDGNNRFTVHDESYLSATPPRELAVDPTRVSVTAPAPMALSQEGLDSAEAPTVGTPPLQPVYRTLDAQRWLHAAWAGPDRYGRILQSALDDVDAAARARPPREDLPARLRQTISRTLLQTELRLDAGGPEVICVLTPETARALTEVLVDELLAVLPRQPPPV